MAPLDANLIVTSPAELKNLIREVLSEKPKAVRHKYEQDGIEVVSETTYITRWDCPECGLTIECHEYRQVPCLGPGCGAIFEVRKQPSTAKSQAPYVVMLDEKQEQEDV
jgi:hypothetical protein